MRLGAEFTFVGVRSVSRDQFPKARRQGRWFTAIKKLLAPNQILFVGVTDPIHPRIETPEEVRDRVLEAAEIIPVESLGTTDDCGFSPFADDTSTSRDTAFAKIRSRVEGTRLASQILGV